MHKAATAAATTTTAAKGLHAHDKENGGAKQALPPATMLKRLTALIDAKGGAKGAK